ncbi:MAG: AAA family ATPase [Gallionella sp.]|nr:AAA family ATPase [Gallionella sp.]
MSNLSVQICITSIRNRGRSGGVIFSGTTDNGDSYVVACNYRLIPEPSVVDKGQIWAVKGAASIREFEANGFRRKETQIQAETAQLMRPSGRNVINWIAECPDCPGIGQVKASKLYKRFGPSLIDHIEQKNIGALTEFISEESAQILCHAFDKHNVANTLLWLDQTGLPRRVGASVVAYFKENAQARIEANPYVLISFEANWVLVDDLARKRLSIEEDAPRRLLSAIEESLYRGLKNGHTCLPVNDVQTRLIKLLGTPQLAKQAMMIGANSAQFRQVDGYYQSTGMYLIESYLANRIHDMVAEGNINGQTSLFAQFGHDLAGVESVINTYERAHDIELSQEQRDAVLTCSGANLSLILGGAGTGKTTVLKAIYEVLETLQPGVAIYQLALAGRAAQRMSEATGRASMTIAGFLLKIELRQIDIGSVIVVDEMSMVDVVLMYRLLRHIPAGIRLILVGDPSQLPPIGPGLVLHALLGVASIAQVELKVVKRQSALSGIPQVAAAIRAHQEPTWTEYLGKPDSGVSFIPCAPERLEETVQRIYRDLGGNGSDFSVQILSITNTNLGGVKNINTALHALFQHEAELIYCYESKFGVVGTTTLEREPMKVGDLVLYTENDYELGLRNGSLGKIIQALPVVKADDPCCVCDFDGAEYKLKTKQMYALKHAYSITVHKSQGSQFRRIIVPIRESRLLDQTLIYTAVTRGIDQVVLVGDVQAALTAIRAPASAARRNITLPMLLRAV